MSADSGQPTQPGGPPVPPGSGGASDLVGTVLAGRYRILEKLGEGAMGAVYLAEHIKIGRKDAIKVLRGPMARDPEAVARFTRGARNVSAIRHPNVCAIYDFSDTSDGLQFMAMEYVPGATLKDILERDGVLPAARAAWISKQVADALQAAHDVDIVHRDLKPGNIMVAQGPDGRDRVKVVDFDIAKGPRDGEASEVTRLGFVVGTPEYMSPEQLMGERLDGRSDIYSLALVAFRALTGSLPFRADNVQDLALKRLTDTPLRLDEAALGQTFPPGLQTVLSRGLQRRPADRYQSAAEFGRDLLAAVQETTPASARAGERSAPPAGAPAPELPATRVAAATSATARTMRRPSRRQLFVGAAIAVIGVLGVTGLLLSRGASPSTSRTATPPASPPPTQAASATGASAAGGGPASPAVNQGAQPAGQSAAAGSDARPAPSPAAGAATEGSRPLASGARTPSSTTPGSTAPGGPARGSAAPVSAARSGARGGAAASGTGSAGGSGIFVATGSARALLGRQMDAISLASAPLGAAALQAIGDTARAVWNVSGVSDADRAFAAYIMGNVLVGLGDTTRAVSWLQRAVSLRPEERGYRQMLDAFRKPRP